MVKNNAWISAQRIKDGKWMQVRDNEIAWVDDPKDASRQLKVFTELMESLVKEFDIPIVIKENPWPNS